MKSTLVFGAVTALAGHATAFWGQMAAGPYQYRTDGSAYQAVYLTDYNTGSTYQGYLEGGFNACSTGVQCGTYFTETSSGGYNFLAHMWRTSDGCHNINFEGALDAGHGYCCGSLPCDFSA